MSKVKWKTLDISMSSGHLFSSMSPVHNNQTCLHGNLNYQRFKFLPSLYSLSPLCDQMKLLLIAFFFVYCCTPWLFVLPSNYSYSHFTSSSSSPKFSCIPPIPLSKPFHLAEAACCFLPETRSLPFTQKCSPSLEYMVLIVPSMQLSPQSHKWKCFVGRCASHISLKRTLALL